MSAAASKLSRPAFKMRAVLTTTIHHDHLQRVAVDPCHERKRTQATASGLIHRNAGKEHLRRASEMLASRCYYTTSCCFH